MARHARIGVTVLAAAATVAAMVAATTLPKGEPTSAAERPATAEPRMNEVQFFGAHNAYHRELQGAEQAEALKIDPGLPSWAYYSHASIPNLLGPQRQRSLELDVLPDPEGGLYAEPLPRKRAGLGPIAGMDEPGMKVQHVPDVDYGTTCPTLVSCLTEVRTWSDEHRGHVPIVIQLELKQTDDRWERLGGAVSPPWDGALLDDLDAEVRSVFDEERLITADDVRRPGLTLEQSVLRHGWPELSKARGKVLFFFDNGGRGPIRDAYLEGHPNLEGRPVFTRGDVGDPDAAITMVNDPRGANAAQIRALVDKGYFVRTRSDEPLTTVRDEEFSRVETALGSGAQMITTDFPSVGMAARYDSDFVAELPGSSAVRCNPVTAAATCRDGALER